MKYAVVRVPLECGYRYDASQYPGGDFRCEKNGIKCWEELDFPAKCPLLDAPPDSGERTIPQHTQPAKCSHCNGYGYEANTPLSPVYPCVECNGTGTQQAGA